MGDILNFNPNREINFSPGRGVDFDPSRDLLFDSTRDLGFMVNRDLGFGKRGVVFRGYVCPVCGAAASETDTRCAECGAVFEGTAPEQPRTAPQKPPKAKKAPRQKPPTRPPAPTAPTSTLRPPPAPAPAPSGAAGGCSRCGARVVTTDQFCWNCGARFVPAKESIPLPPRSSGPPATREWRDTGKDFQEFVR